MRAAAVRGGPTLTLTLTLTPTPTLTPALTLTLARTRTRTRTRTVTLTVALALALTRRRASLQQERDELTRGAQAFAEQMARVRAACARLQGVREARAATRLQAHARGGAGRRSAGERRATRSEQEWLARGYEQLLVEVPHPNPNPTP